MVPQKRVAEKKDFYFVSTHGREKQLKHVTKIVKYLRCYYFMKAYRQIINLLCIIVQSESMIPTILSYSHDQDAVGVGE